MQKKSKVVAFRVNDEEYEALKAGAAWCKASNDETFVGVKSVANLVEFMVKDELQALVLRLHKAKKNAEAAAKRKATKEAKQAANDAK